MIGIARRHFKQLGRDLESEAFRGIATVYRPIEPGQQGRVRFRASLWKALSDANCTILTGTQVEVIKRENLTLIVRPIV